jgi:hypothetical protein
MTFEYEHEAVAFIFRILVDSIHKQNIHIQKEGKLDYLLPNGKVLSHRSDILLSKGNTKFISIEIKNKSAVTDQFKCRSYDMFHLKRQLGENILGVMIYIKNKGNGISLEQAKYICYPFELFIGLKIEDLTYENIFVPLIDAVNAYFDGS